MKNIIYLRKSSEAEDRQALSLESQAGELKALAAKLNIRIDKAFQESKSAKAIGRPQFNEMIKFIKSNPGSKILVWKLDRLARNFRDGGEIISLLQENIIAEIITPFGNHNPNDNVLSLAVEFGTANQFVRNLSQDVKRGNRTKLEKGELPGAAPIGYLDNLLTKKKEIDPIKSVFIKKAFELYATGGYSLKEINNIVYEKGFTTKGGLKNSKAQFHHILQNPFYYGVIRRNGQLYPGQHQPIISKTLFDDVQYVLSGKSRPKKQKHFFPVRGFMFCNLCGCLLTATTKKGHAYYYCTNGKGKCLEHTKYLRDKAVDELVAETFKEIKFDEQMIEFAYRSAKAKIIHSGDNIPNQKDELAKQLKTAQDKLSNLADIISSDPQLKEALKAKILNLEADTKLIQKQILQAEAQPQQDPLVTLEQTKKAFLQACSASFDYLNADDNKKSELLKKLLWNLKIEKQKVQCYQFKAPYSLMAQSPKNLILSDWLALFDQVGTYITLNSGYLHEKNQELILMNLKA